MNLKTTKNQKWGLYDTKDDCWLGGDEGPKTFDDEDLAQVACRIIDVQAKRPAGRTRARVFNEGPLRKKDEIAIYRSGEDAIERLESGLEL